MPISTLISSRVVIWITETEWAITGAYSVHGFLTGRRRDPALLVTMQRWEQLACSLRYCAAQKRRDQRGISGDRWYHGSVSSPLQPRLRSTDRNWCSR